MSGRFLRRQLALVLALLTALCNADGHAHEVDELIPEQRGLAVGLAAAGSWLDARQPIPARRLTGVTGMGDTPRDSRGWALEHAMAGLGVRWLPWLTTAVAMGVHGGEKAHVEAAWLQLELDDGLSGPSGDRALAIGAGRARIPTGPVIVAAGHLDRFAQMPLAKRGAFNGDWIEDGINLRWQPHLDGAWAWLDTVELGGWRARRFPGAADGGIAPLLHLGIRLGDLSMDGFLTRLEPEGRGSYVQREGSGHIHTAPRCDASLQNIVCFDGRVDLVGASLAWETPWPGIRVQAATLLRRERGRLYSANGGTDYRGRSSGGWIDLLWTPVSRWELGLRQEWLRGRNDLRGIGATRVASDASLLPDHPAWRSTAMLAFVPDRTWRISAEIGRESVGGVDATVFGLRLIWSPAPWIGPPRRSG